MRVVIAGSGIVGAACASHCASRGADVAVVDADVPGRATDAGAGIVCPWSSRVDDRHWRAFAVEAARAYPALVARLAEAGHDEVGYRKVGAISILPSRSDRDAFRQWVLEHNPDASEMGAVEAVSGSDAQSLFPPLPSDSWGVHIEGAARVDGRLLRRALLADATAHGARLVTGHAVPAVDNGRTRGVTVGDERIDADVVVAATGAWTDRFLRPAGISVAVTPQRGQIVHLDTGADTGQWPVLLPGASGHYLLAFDEGHVVIGATRETGAGFDHRVTAGGLSEVLDEALAVAPGLATASYVETRIGFRPMGPDVRPLLGSVAGMPGLIVATGLGASGLTMGPLAGEVAGRVALGEEVGVDLAPFDPMRAATHVARRGWAMERH